MTDSSQADPTASIDVGLSAFADVFRRIAAYAIRWGRPTDGADPEASMGLDVAVVNEWTPGHTGVVVEWTPFNSVTYSLAFETEQP